MHIEATAKILGWPILEIRKLLRKGRKVAWNTERAAEILHTDTATAAQLLAGLAEQGYIEPAPRQFTAGCWVNTPQGNTLANASAAPRINRQTATRALAQFLQRVQTVNSADYYLYRVQQVVVFGSYLSEAPKISDLDLAVELEPKEADPQRHQELYAQRITDAVAQGRHFRDMADMYGWPRLEVYRFLKARSRTISLHELEIESRHLSPADYRVVYTATAGLKPQ